MNFNLIYLFFFIILLIYIYLKMSATINHELLPQNNADSFKANDQIEFIIDCPVNRSIVANSICIQADLRVNSTGTTRCLATDEIYFDSLTGSHGIFQSFTTTLDSAGLVESYQNYGRAVRMNTETSMSSGQLFRADKVCELVSPSDVISQSYNCGTKIVNTGQTTSFQDIDFNIMPMIAINKTSTNIPQSKTGRINIIAILERNFGFLYGSGNADGNYSISNVRLQFRSVPSLKTDLKTTSGKLQLFSTQSQKTTLLSNRSNVSISAPDIVSSVYCSFLKQVNEFGYGNNNMRTEVINGIDSVRFLMNDSQSNNIVYEQNTYDEILKNYNETLEINTLRAKFNSINQKYINRNDGFGIGQSFGGVQSLLNNKLDIELNTSGPNSILPSNPYVLYVYMNSIVQV